MIAEISNGIKKSLLDQGQDVGIQSLITGYMNNDQKVRDAVKLYEMSLDANATSAQLGMRYPQRQ